MYQNLLHYYIYNNTLTNILIYDKILSYKNNLITHIMSPKFKNFIPGLPREVEAKEKGTRLSSQLLAEEDAAREIIEMGGFKIKGVIEAPTSAEAEKKCELTPEQQTEILNTLEARFASKPKHYKRLEGVNFAEVKATLEANPHLLYSLAQMENAGGEPDIVAIENDAFVFGDCSYETPKGHRNLNFDESAELAKDFGAELMSEQIWLNIQKSGNFDELPGNGYSWLATSKPMRKILGLGLYGYRAGDKLKVNGGIAIRREHYWGSRFIVRVKKA
jgi:hypothetical protein